MPNATPFCTLRLLALTCGLSGLLAVSVSADAAGPIQRTFVASYGVDPAVPGDYSTRPCNLPLPCRTFNAAIGNTLGGGELVILDTAGYGPMTINKSIKVIGPSGVYGGISVQGGGGATTGIVINAGPSDDITLRGLDISGVPGAAPLPDIGIDIQNAGGVHIEKSSIGNFNQDTSACIKVNVSSTVRVYVDDSFLRACRTGIYANGTNAAVTNLPSVVVDNTRIERGRGPIQAFGVWLQGAIDVSLRNSLISRQDVGIQFDSLLGGKVSHVELIKSELTRNTTALNFVNATASAQGQIAISGSQIFGSTDAIKIANSAVGGNTTVSLVDSQISYTGGSGIQLADSAADPNTRVYMEFVRSQINNITGIAVDLNATNGSKTYFDARDSTVSHAGGLTGSLIKTSGTSRVAVSLIRSDFRHATTILDHGNGEVRIDGSHFVQCTQSFVNNGSGAMFSLNNNYVACDDLPGPPYITPTKILTK